MSFCSVEYAVFLIAVVGLYWLLPHTKRWILLLAASYVFYGCWNAKYLLLIFAETLLSYLIAKKISQRDGYQKRYLALGVVLTLALLFFFKYLGFAQSNLMRLFGFSDEVIRERLWNILLPVGISFYTFQCISYMADVYREKAECEERFGVYALYIAFFPQLVAGPIERSSDIIPQLKKEQHFSYERFTYGLKLIAWGAFKKMIIADFFAYYVETVYENVYVKPGGSMVFATVLFAFEIYCDFSGYSDIARGSASLMGIRLMENFRAPYLSQNIQEFWRRWHISLSSWLKDYIYIPLGGSRKGKISYVRNIMITFGLSGLWHGANWTYVLWGLMHGVYHIFEKAVKRCKAERYMIVWVNRLLTFCACLLGWIFFRASSIRDAWYIITHMFSGIGSIKTYVISAYQGLYITKYIFVQMVLVLAVLFFYDLASLKTDVIAWIGKQRVGVRWSIYSVFMSFFAVSYILWGSSGSQFIYFQF